ncbi:DUF167 domain-containing protein [bacterium]|nr:DUF167 domain-containing protein [bacterium]
MESTADGVILPVRAQPGSRKNAVTGVHDSRLKVAVTQVAEKGKANDAIAAVLAEALDLKPSQLQLVSGATNPLKKFLVTGMSHQELDERIMKLVGS